MSYNTKLELIQNIIYKKNKRDNIMKITAKLPKC